MAKIFHHAQIVGDEQEGQIEPFPQFQKQVDDLRLNRDVERGDRFVRHDQAGIEGDGAGDADALSVDYH